MKWKTRVKFRDLCGLYNSDADELQEVQRVKPFWIERFNTISCLKHFVPSLKKVRTLNEFNKWLNKVYDYCDDNATWVELD